MSSDRERIAQLERDMLDDPPHPLYSGHGYVVLLNSKDEEASDRTPVSFTVAVRRGKFMVTINRSEPINIAPTHLGVLRPVIVPDTGGWITACNPATYTIPAGGTFTLHP